MSFDPATVFTALPPGRRRRVQVIVGAAVGGGMGAFAAPWWAWIAVFTGLWLGAAVLHRKSPTYLLTRCTA